MEYNGIILSGPPLAGKSTIAEEISTILGWEEYSIGQLWRNEWKRKFPDGEVSFEEFWAGTTIEDNRRMDEQAKARFLEGKVVSDLRYSHFCLDIPGLLVLVTADLEVRAERAVGTERYKNKTFSEVKKILKRRERDEVRTGRNLYGQSYDYRDPMWYHLVLNTSKLTLEQEVAAIFSMVNGIQTANPRQALLFAK